MCSWNDMIQMMKHWIDKDIENIPSLSEFAERLGYSYFYATKKFHEVEGITFREYIVSRNLQRFLAYHLWRIC